MSIAMAMIAVATSCGPYQDRRRIICLSISFLLASEASDGGGLVTKIKAPADLNL